MSEESDQLDTETVTDEPEIEVPVETDPTDVDGTNGDASEDGHATSDENASDNGGSLETDSAEAESQQPLQQAPDEIKVWEQRYKHLQAAYTQGQQHLKAYREVGDDPEQLKQSVAAWKDYQGRVSLKPHHPSSPDHPKFRSAYQANIQAHKNLDMMRRSPGWQQLDPETQVLEERRILQESGVTDETRTLMNEWASSLQEETNQFQMMGPSAFVQEQVQRIIPEIQKSAVEYVFSIMNAQKKVDSFMDTNKNLIQDEQFSEAYNATGNADFAAKFAAMNAENAKLRAQLGTKGIANAGNKARAEQAQGGVRQSTGGGNRGNQGGDKLEALRKKGASNAEIMSALFDS
jgi:hypothetical protein